MRYEFTDDAIILSPLLSKVVLQKEEITGVSMPTDYAPANGILVGSIQYGMDAVMIHTNRGNFYFYTGTPQAFMKKAQDFFTV
ncbi:hypothetical protein [Ectobacillus ponti]|uniref:Uncharacterized protein n=1 Tax=Ectobacillus ponti TaxID=2961894 RepID=A0AA42BQG9_9BACI|nr:hypothetical protein [Ectobacillus ponti]MCP8968439.1 hypothetical protein [Ectobacillus ponti]